MRRSCWISSGSSIERNVLLLVVVLFLILDSCAQLTSRESLTLRTDVIPHRSSVSILTLHTWQRQVAHGFEQPWRTQCLPLLVSVACLPCALPLLLLGMLAKFVRGLVSDELHILYLQQAVASLPLVEARTKAILADSGRSSNSNPSRSPSSCSLWSAATSGLATKDFK